MSISSQVATDWRTELDGDLGQADYHRLARVISKTAARSEASWLQPVKVAALSSHSLQFIKPFLVVEGARQGLLIQSYFGDFGQFEQQLLDDNSPLYRFDPDILVFSLRFEDVDPDAMIRFHATGGQRFEQLAGELCERLGQSVEIFGRRSSAPVLIANFAPPGHLPLGVFDANVGDSLTYGLDRTNTLLWEVVDSQPNAFVWDYAGLVVNRGVADWTDPRLWALGRIAIAAHHQPALASHIVRTICGVRHPPAKCLALDLDNTLWGGVIGDDGMAGIQVGDDYPGNAFKAFQRSVLALMDRGVLIAVVSKNNEEVAKAAFQQHPEMLIRWEHLSAARINWEPKSKNLREIAAELNIGADAIVFADDNPVERAEVRANAPEVLVLDLPPNPLEYCAALASCPFFDQTAVSEEDRSRGGMYRQQRARREFEQRFETVEDFLHSLEMTASIGEVDPTTLGRISQLVAKTNQFNLTTRRHSEADILRMTSDPSNAVVWLRLRDRFGDQGLVGVGILRKEDQRGVIDTFLMSCRVMNRQVERALMAYLLDHARRLGCKEVMGEYCPTPKNQMVRSFYPDLGFATCSDSKEGQRFMLNLTSDGIEWPDVIRCELPSEKVTG
jgi:FkbH-like protein